MEKELNIATILKDKPLDIKLWTDIFGEVTLDYVSKNGNGFNVKHHHSVLDKFLPNGKIYEEGALCIYPSKSMRDWSKFAWKKGDVLFSNNTLVVFNRFVNDDYTDFEAAFEGYQNETYDEGNIFFTDDFSKATDDGAKDFIKNIEGHYGGKLNLETLEIDKPQFKDGDIMYMEAIADSYIFIFNKNDNGLIRSRVCFSIKNKVLIDFGFTGLAYEHNYKYIRPATEEEKQQLFAALAKKGKRWNSETKTLVDLPKKCEFKPKDWCLMRDFYETWKLCQFGFMEKGHVTGNTLYDAVGGNTYEECIPYNDQTAHLLGTNDDYEEGGEG